MKKCMAVLIVSLIVGLSGCGDKADTSTGGASADLSRGENTITTDSGGLIYVVYDDKVNIDDVVRFKYVVRNSVEEDQSGTLHWGDNSSSRVRGNGLLKHIYRAPGIYKIAIQPDGEDKLVVGAIIVTSIVCDTSTPFFVIPGTKVVAKPNSPDSLNSSDNWIRNFYGISTKNGCLELTTNINSHVFSQDTAYIYTTYAELNYQSFINIHIWQEPGQGRIISMNCHNNLARNHRNQCTRSVDRNIDFIRGTADSTLAFKIVIGSYKCTGTIQLTGFSGRNASVAAKPISVICND